MDNMIDVASLVYEDYPKNVQLALKGVLRGDPSYPRWVWFHCMDTAACEEIDDWLVKIKHPLACEAGTREDRFRDLVRELAEKLKKMDEADEALYK